MEKNVNSMKSVYFSAFTAGLLSYTFGTVLTIMTGTKQYFGDDVDFGLIGSIPCLGAIFGSFIQFRSSKNTFFVISVLYMIGYAGMSLKKEYVLIFRFIAGLATGSVCSTVPNYLSSISPIELRGRISLIHQLFLSLGILSGSIFTSHISAYRLFIGISFVPFLVFIFTSCTINQNFEPVNIKITFFKRKSLIMLITLHVIQQLALINPIVIFTPEYLGEKVPGKKTYIFNIIGLISSLSATFFIDKLGRKILLLGSYAVVLFALIGFSFGYNSISAFVYIIGFCFGAGPITWILGAEIFDPEYIPGAMAIATITNWGFGFVLTLLFKALHKKMAEYAFATFAPFILAGIFIFAKFLPETKGRLPKCL